MIKSVEFIRRIYLDDILIASKDEEHKKHLELVLSRLDKFGLRINLNKCLFGLKEILFLGFLVNEKGIVPDSERVSVILRKKLPDTSYANI